MTKEGIEQLLVGVFAAAGRSFGHVEVAVYGEVLANLNDDVGLEAGRSLWDHVSWEHPPSPRLVREAAQAILRRQQENRPALVEDTGPPADPEVARAWLASIKQRRRGDPVTDSDVVWNWECLSDQREWKA